MVCCKIGCHWHVACAYPVAVSDPCWGRHLHGSFGPGLHYAGHDYFPASPTFPPEGAGRQIEIELHERRGFQSGEFALLTLAVTGSEVVFYENTRELGRTRLVAPLSDCLNDGVGVLTGEAGMEIGDLRFHPVQLTGQLIEELLFNGGSLGDFSSGSQPAVLKISEIEALHGSVTSSISDLDKHSATRKVSSDIKAVIDRNLQGAASSGSASGYSESPPAPLGDIAANQTSIVDVNTNREYHSLYMGPGRLTETRTIETHRFIKDAPLFTGTGATLSFWYRAPDCSDPTDACGVFLFSAFEGTPASAQRCWTLWLERGKVLFPSLAASPGRCGGPGFDLAPVGRD